ncbi:hypothetical protein EAS64_02410 [Trebonia kvetii]|uniref:Uncharacterized protein n=1 Tax=Trebonia kvetii TaxID=2480626 RepID=A0A6P2C4J8_9ACTN|nr:hypothetical protein [Trebonia kvetii]TVZ06304.1 hypothetical protein EAS64_02410 [Trebonia kvetii]
MQLALVEITPWRIAPGWVDAWQSDQRTEWTSLAAEATLSGTTVAGLAGELSGLEDRGLLRWDQGRQAAVLAAGLDDANALRRLG